MTIVSIPEIMSDILKAKAELVDLHLKRKSEGLKDAMEELENAHSALNQARILVHKELMK